MLIRVRYRPRKRAIEQASLRTEQPDPWYLDPHGIGDELAPRFGFFANLLFDFDQLLILALLLPQLARTPIRPLLTALDLSFLHYALQIAIPHFRHGSLGRRR